MAAPNYDTTTATDWYVDSARLDNSGDGRSWATAKQTLGAVFTAFTSTDPKIVYIKAGSILQGDNNCLVAIEINKTNVCIVTAVGLTYRDYIITKAAREATKIVNNGSRNYCLYTTQPHWFLKNITLEIGRNATTSLSLPTGADDFVAEDVDIITSSGILLTDSSSQLTLDNNFTGRRLGIRGHGGRYFSLTGTSSCTVTFDQCVFEGDGIASGQCLTKSRSPKRNNYGNVANANATVNIHNSICVDSGTYGLLVSNGTVNVYNSIFSGSSSHSDSDGIKRTGGTVNVYNGIVNNFGVPSSANSTPTIKSGMMTGKSPEITSYARGGFVIPCIDDFGNATLVHDMFIPALKSRGLKGSWFCQPGWCRTWSGQSANYFENNILPLMQSIVLDGTVEVGSHSWSHSPQTSAMTKLGTLSGPAGSSITIDATTITFKNSGGTVLWSKQWDDSTVWGEVFYSNESTATVRTELSGWSIVYATDGTNVMGSTLKIKELATKTLTTTPTDLTLNANYLSVESADSKAKLTLLLGSVVDPQTGVNYQCNSIATPYGTNDETFRDRYRTDGYLGCRCIGATYDLLSDIDLFGQNYIPISNLWVGLAPDGGANDLVVKNRTLGMCFTAACSGNIVYILGHTDTVDYWSPVLDALQEYNNKGVTVTSMQLACASLRSAPWTYDPATGCSTRTYIGKNDYHIRPGSTCLGAGTKIPGITTDIEGNPLVPPYNIGPYGLAEGALGVAPVVNNGPPRNNITRLTGTSTTINPEDTYQFDDTNGWRVVTGWTAGTANFGFDANGVPIPFSGQQLIDSGIGPRIYCGSTWIAGYTVDQENPEQLSSWC